MSSILDYLRKPNLSLYEVLKENPEPFTKQTDKLISIYVNDQDTYQKLLKNIPKFPVSDSDITGIVNDYRKIINGIRNVIATDIVSDAKSGLHKSDSEKSNKIDKNKMDITDINKVATIVAENYLKSYIEYQLKLAEGVGAKKIRDVNEPVKNSDVYNQRLFLRLMLEVYNSANPTKTLLNLCDTKLKSASEQDKVAYNIILGGNKPATKWVMFTKPSLNDIKNIKTEGEKEQKGPSRPSK